MTGHNFKKKRPVSSSSSNGEECVIMNEGDGSSSVTSESEHGGSDPPRILHGKTIRQFLDEFLHATKFQVFIIALVIFNCLIVIVELLIDLRVFELQRENNIAASILRYLSIVILSLFVLEMAAKALTFRKRFLKHRMEIFDAVVILVTFSLTLVFFGKKESSANGIGLLIMLRLWRVNKILNSMVASVRKEAERKMAKERRARRALEREVAKLREYCLQQECELQMYRLMLQQNNIPQPTVLRPPPAPRTLNVIAEVNEAELQGGNLNMGIGVCLAGTNGERIDHDGKSIHGSAGSNEGSRSSLEAQN